MIVKTGTKSKITKLTGYELFNKDKLRLTDYNQY